MKGTLTRQQAINAFCKMCIYDPEPGNGTWRQQVEDCTADGRGGASRCPLYDYRPLADHSGRNKKQVSSGSTE